MSTSWLASDAGHGHALSSHISISRQAAHHTVVIAAAPRSHQAVVPALLPYTALVLVPFWVVLGFFWLVLEAGTSSAWSTKSTSFRPKLVAVATSTSSSKTN